MNLERAKELLTALADGVNPLSGELLADEDSCNQLEIVRALNIVLRTLDTQPGKPTTEKAGTPWSRSDEDLLCELFDAGCAKKEICDRLGRSSVAIAARLVKLGKIRERDEFQKI